MPRRLILLAALAAPLAFPAGAGAQTRTIVVPEGAEVVVPPRGAALPRAAPKPVAQRRRLPPLEPARERDGWAAAGAVAGVALPAVAAAVAALVLSNGGNGAPHGTTAPARTR